MRFLKLASLMVMFFLSGCGTVLLPPLTSQYELLSTDVKAQSSVANESKVLIYNNSSKLMFGLDGTGKINVTVNEKALAGLQIGEYVQFQLAKGNHTVELVHIDVFPFRSTHVLSVNDDPLFVEIEATVVSNALRTFKQLPAGNDLPKPFEPYRP